MPLTDALVTAAVHRFRGLSPRLALRTADAIHLVSAHAHGFGTIYSNDTRLLAAAPEFGLRGKTV